MPEFDLPEQLHSDTLNKQKFIKLLRGLTLSGDENSKLKLLSQIVSQGASTSGFIRIANNEVVIEELDSSDGSMNVSGASLSLNVAKVFGALFSTANRDEISTGTEPASIDRSKVVTVITDHERTINLGSVPEEFTLKFILNASSGTATVNENGETITIPSKAAAILFGVNDVWVVLALP